MAVKPCAHNACTRCNSTYRLRYWNLPLIKLTEPGVTSVLQQRLPLAVLKLQRRPLPPWFHESSCNSAYRLRYWNTSSPVPISILFSRCNSTYRLRYWNFCNTVEAQLLYTQLQQHLPLAVLKRYFVCIGALHSVCQLQQYLPFTVLKHHLGCGFSKPNKIKEVATALTVYGIETFYLRSNIVWTIWSVATALTVYGIETLTLLLQRGTLVRCNSTYRLRYWNPSPAANS